MGDNPETALIGSKEVFDKIKTQGLKIKEVVLDFISPVLKKFFKQWK